MNTAPLPKEIVHRINKDSDAWVNPRVIYAGYMQSSYIEGATIEATRALLLIEALKKIQGICDHDDYGNAAMNCPVCIAHFAIEEYNQQP